MPRRVRYDQGWRDGVAAAAKALQTMSVSPPDAVVHIRNAGGALLWMLESGHLTPPKPGASPNKHPDTEDHKGDSSHG